MTARWRRLVPATLVCFALGGAAARAGAAGDGPDDAATLAPRVSADAVGKSVHVLAAGLAPGARVHIGAGPVDSEYELLAAARADAVGRIDLSVRLFAELDSAWVIVLEDSNGRVIAISNPFPQDGTVTSGLAPGGGVVPALSRRDATGRRAARRL